MRTLFLAGLLLAPFAHAEPEPFYGYKEPVIHPSMQEAIDFNETKITGHMADDDQTVSQPTGFNPTADFYRGAKYINVKADPDIIAKFAEKGLDYREFSFSPVRGQIWGSCWAEGSVSAFELNWNAVIPGAKNVFAVQDVIDCSGFGTARGGGQLSVEYALNGLAFESDYPYHGKDGRCQKGIERHNPLKEVAILRGEKGGFPTEPELLTAFFKYGAMEVCGSAGALGSGGRQDQPRSGRTNHCYAIGSAVPGKAKGWLDAWYWGIKNSWGDGTNSPLNLSKNKWGDKGWGDYRLAPDGKKIQGSVVTEIMLAFAGDRVPPAPVTFTIESKGTINEVTVQPFAALSVSEVQARLETLFKDLEGE